MFVLAKPGSVGDFVAGPGPVGGSRECGAVIQEDHDPALVGNDLLDVEMIEGTDGTTDGRLRDASKQSLQDAVAHSIDEERSRSAVCVRRRGHCVR